MPDEAADGFTLVVFPATDALAKLDPGDVLTIETGDDLGDGLVDMSIEVRCAKRFDAQVEKPLLGPNI